MEHVNKKLFTLEISNPGTSTWAPPVAAPLHIYNSGVFDVSDMFAQVQALVAERPLGREKINPHDSSLNTGMESFDLSSNHTDQ